MTRDATATRRRLLEQARRQFVRSGYTAVTVKGVADAAGVSPNLVTRYFGGKEGLFLAATEVTIPVTDSFDGDVGELGERLAGRIVERWYGQTDQDPLLVLHRASGERPEAAEALSSFLDRSSVEPLERYFRACGLADDDARGRAVAIDALVLGVSTRWRVLRSELGDRERFRVWLAGAIQKLADG